MQPFDIFIHYLEWGAGGKKRPVLVYELEGSVVSAYAITSQYASKSEAVRANYFKINDWAQAGLDKQSYVDTGRTLDLPSKAINGKNPIGRLTESDRKRILEFLDN